MQKVIEIQTGFKDLPPEQSAQAEIAVSGIIPEIKTQKFVLELLIIVTLAACSYIALAFFWIKFSRAEVFFAECAREMLVTNNFVTPLYHAQPFFDKPIFVYWLIIAMFKTLGITHMAARLPSIFASLATIICTALAGSYLFGKRAGLISAFILSSSFMYLSFSTLCMSDMFLVAFDTLSLTAIYAGIISAQRRTLYWWLAAVSMGFAFLTKGPVGILLPALASLIYLSVKGNLSLIKVKHILLAFITITFLASPWFYAAYLANGPQSMVHFFIQENIQRFAGSTYDAHRPFWYTIISLFLGFAPWSILLPFVFAWFCASFKKSDVQLDIGANLNTGAKLDTGISLNTGEKLNITALSKLPIEISSQLFLWIWLFVSVGFFCFSRGKCDYYTLPAFPAAALLCADYPSKYLPKYIAYIKAISIAILISTIAFSAIALPQINKYIPVYKYADLIKQAPNEVQIGVDNSIASWIDEILFQSGKDPICLSSTEQINAFINKNKPTVLILPLDKYNQLIAGQHKKFHILSYDAVITHSLTPGYIISKGGQIIDSTPLVVASNIDDLR